jgi:hypothetical protein
MRTRTFLLLTLALATMLAIGCGDVEVEKEVQIGKSVTIGGFTNDQLRSPEFRNCLEGMVKLLQEDVHTHTYLDKSGATDWEHQHGIFQDLVGRTIMDTAGRTPYFQGGNTAKKSQSYQVGVWSV